MLILFWLLKSGLCLWRQEVVMVVLVIAILQKELTAVIHGMKSQVDTCLLQNRILPPVRELNT